MLSSNDKVLMEEQLFRQVVTPIEIYLKPEMTDVEKARAKINSYEAVKKAIKEFCQEKNVEEKEIILEIKNWLTNITNQNNQMQVELVNDMLNNMLPKKENSEKTYGNA